MYVFLTGKVNAVDVTPPHKVLEDGKQTLLQADLTPAALINLGFTDNGPSRPGLSDALMGTVQELSVIEPVVKPTEKVEEKKVDTGEQKVEEKKVDTGEQKVEEKKVDMGEKKLPAWLKLSKK